MKRILFVILVTTCCVCCTHSMSPDDLSLNMLCGPVSEVIPSAGGEMIRYDSAGRIIYTANVDEWRNPTDTETSYRYLNQNGNKTDRIECISRNGEMVNRRRCEITCRKSNMTVRYFKVRRGSKEKIFTYENYTFSFRGNKPVRFESWDGSSTEYHYKKGYRLPFKMVVNSADGSVSSTLYEYPDIDSMGNWLTRLSIREGQTSVLESRMIKYYKQQ